MNLEGEVNGNILKGSIHNFVIDDTLSIRGAAAEAKATGEAIGELKEIWDNVEGRAAAAAAEAIEAQVAIELANITAQARTIAEEQAEEAIKDITTLSAAEIRAICI